MENPNVHHDSILWRFALEMSVELRLVAKVVMAHENALNMTWSLIAYESLVVIIK